MVFSEATIAVSNFTGSGTGIAGVNCGRVGRRSISM